MVEINGHEVVEGDLIFDIDFTCGGKKAYGKYPYDKVVQSNQKLALKYMEKSLVERLRKG